ncbi:MAG TPA: acetylxylan esterase [Planctomycetota bacterium]|nr:acetylxylan esterase [Planctomycetota bacterium]
MKNAAAQRKLLYSLLGDLPPRQRAVKAKLVAEETRETYVLEKLALDLNGLETVPACFARPRQSAPPYPAILYNHSHGGFYHVGKKELIDGAGYLQMPPYAEELARRGIASLCIDTWNFGERHGRSESELFKEMLWKGRVLWGMMVYDSLRAADYLLSRRDVNAERVGTLGLSMGATMAWWTAALDERIKVTVDLCCMTDFQALVETRHLDGHGIYYYVPSLLKHFDTVAINALIAPRPHLSLNGNFDKLTPPHGLDRVDAELKRVYRRTGKPEAWRMYRRDHGHFETAEMRAEILGWLVEWL